MILCFDIGNSRSKYVTMSASGMSSISYLATENITESWLTEHFSAISSCLISNVTNEEINNFFATWSKKNNSKLQIIKSESSRFGITCAYEKVSSFGVDRWLALVGAKSFFPKKHVLVIDAGTATTIDYLHKSGLHHGGMILPGIDTLFSSLLKNTENVVASQHQVEEIAFGKNTSECVNYACWAATIGAIEQAIKTIQTHFIEGSDELLVLFTGGNAKHLDALIENNSKVIDELIFVGMQGYC